MSHLLTKNEVNALLSNHHATTAFAPLPEPVEKTPEARVICERFLRLFQVDLAQYLKKKVHLSHVSTDEMKFNELKMILNHKKSVRLLQLNHPKAKAYGLFVFDNNFCNDQKLLNTVAYDLEKALEPLGPYIVHFAEKPTETIPSNENMVLMTFEIEHTPKATMSIILPSAVLKNNIQSDSKMSLDLLLDVPLKVTVELGRTKIKVQDILKLSRGSVVELPTLTKEPLSILVNDELIAKGEVVVVNEKFAMRLTEIISPEQRVERLK